jgi:hypothetical protein
MVLPHHAEVFIIQFSVQRVAFYQHWICIYIYIWSNISITSSRDFFHSIFIFTFITVLFLCNPFIISWIATGCYWYTDIQVCFFVQL